MTALRSVADVLRQIPRTRRTVVGIAGSPGSGKSTLGEAVVDALGPSAVLLPMDGYHFPQARLVELGRRDRMGAPDTFDVAAFIDTLIDLRESEPHASSVANEVGMSGRQVLARGFDRGIEEPVLDAIRISPEIPIVVIEGNYLLLESGGWQAVAPLLDVTFFVSVSPDIRRRRLIERHVKFGKTPIDAEAWALGPDEANARLIEPTRSRADFVVDWR